MATPLAPTTFSTTATSRFSRKAKENCDYLIAGVVHDDVLEVTKGRRPVIPIEERAAIVSHIDYVDEVHIETTPDKLKTWKQKPFNVFFKGDDWKGTDRATPWKHASQRSVWKYTISPHRAHLQHQAVQGR